MNILVTGANGQLGMSMRDIAPRPGDRFIFSDITPRPNVDTVCLDITNPDAIRLVCESEQVDVIVNCAAYTDVERAESDPYLAGLLNNTAVGYLARVAAERDAFLIHISTDYVFGGRIPIPLREDFPTEPLGVYGATKLQGEQAVAASGCRSLIVRTAWLYSRYGKNFYKTMRTLTAAKPSLKVVFDQVGSPTCAADLAAFLHWIIAQRMLDRTNLCHFTNEGVCSWYDFACAIRDLCGNTCEIVPCHSADYPSKVQRPAWSVLDKTRARQTFGIDIPHWYDALRRCAQEDDAV